MGDGLCEAHMGTAESNWPHAAHVRAGEFSGLIFFFSFLFLGPKGNGPRELGRVYLAQFFISGISVIFPSFSCIFS